MIRIIKKSKSGETSNSEKLRIRLLEKENQGSKDIIDMMTSNLNQIEDYYIISKSNAQRAFTWAVIFCISGFALFAASVFIAFTIKLTDFAVIATIGGAASELFAATALIVHNGTQKQLNYYYEALHENEQFLSTVHLVSKLPDEEQAKAYNTIIESSLKMLIIKYENKTSKNKT